MTQPINFIFLFVFLLLCATGCGQVKNNDSKSRQDEVSIAELNQQIPATRGWINDFANILADDEIKKLDSIVSNYEKKSTVEISVVTLDSTYTTGDNFDNYSLVLALKWGVGKKEKNNGILIAMSPDLRRIRIRNGFGIENIVSNAETQQIIDEISLPQFRNGLFYEGLKLTILELIKKLEEKD
jgi:uncharacterized protein